MFLDKPLNLAIDSLVSTYDLNIVYQDRIINNITIDAICKDCNGDEAIKSLLNNTSLEWKKK